MLRQFHSYIVVLLAISWTLSSCQPKDQAPCDTAAVSIKAPEAEVASLKQYIESNHITATADPRGFYYAVKAAGTGTKPTVCSNVSVNYKGQLTNGNSFDSGNNISFGLNQLIIGWQEGIPLIAPGGSVTLYLPPSLAYGEQEQGDIPANSILVFQIDLLSIN